MSVHEGRVKKPVPDFQEKLNPKSSVKHVIGIVSGKGGVGKSLVTTMLVVKLRAMNYRVGVLDADITGPSIPKSLGIHGLLGVTSDNLMLPAESATGIQVVSANLILENETEPVIWRGPMVAGVIKQFWSETWWRDIDFMLVDMPPGTGDVALTVFQSLPVDGIIVVTSPQDLVSMIVMKAVNMADKMNVPILGLVENYSYLTCPDCGKKIQVFGESHLDEVSRERNIPVLARLPINPAMAARIDEGMAETVDCPELDVAVKVISGLEK